NICGAIGVQTTSANQFGWSDLVIGFLVDGGRAAGAFPGGGGGEGIVFPMNSTNTVGVQTWSQCYTFPNGVFAAGSTHTFQLAAQGEGNAGGSSATVGALSSSMTAAQQGQLWVEVIEE